jgi:hypothetical protein
MISKLKAIAVVWQNENGSLVRTKSSAIKLSQRSAGMAFAKLCAQHKLKFTEVRSPFTGRRVEICDEDKFQKVLKTITGNSPALEDGSPTIWLGDFRKELQKLGRAGSTTWAWMERTCPFLGGAKLRYGQEETGDCRRYVDCKQAETIKEGIRRQIENGTRKHGRCQEKFDGVYEVRDNGDRLVTLAVARRKFGLKFRQLETAIGRGEIQSETRPRRTWPRRGALCRVLWESAVSSWIKAEKQRRQPFAVPGFESAREIADRTGAKTPAQIASLGAALAHFRKTNPACAIQAPSNVRRRLIWLYKLPGAHVPDAPASPRPDPVTEAELTSGLSADPRFAAVLSIVQVNPTMKQTAIRSAMKRFGGIKNAKLKEILDELSKRGIYHKLPQGRTRKKIP